MILKKCQKCKEYNLTELCRSCKEKTQDAHYKFIRLRDCEMKNELTAKNI